MRSTKGQFVSGHSKQAREKMNMNDEIHEAYAEEHDGTRDSDQDTFDEELDLSPTTPTDLPSREAPETFESLPPSRSRLIIVDSLPRRKGRSHSPVRPKGYVPKGKPAGETTNDTPSS